MGMAIIEENNDWAGECRCLVGEVREVVAVKRYLLSGTPRIFKQGSSRERKRGQRSRRKRQSRVTSGVGVHLPYTVPSHY